MTRELTVELKALRLHGMAEAWADLVEQGANASLDSSRWLLEHLLAAEGTDRAMRSVSHQMHAAKFPVHRDLAGFDFEASPVDRKLVHQLADLSFTEAAGPINMAATKRLEEQALRNKDWNRDMARPVARTAPFCRNNRAWTHDGDPASRWPQ
jgi:hypothetical protein